MVDKWLWRGSGNLIGHLQRASGSTENPNPSPPSLKSSLMGCQPFLGLYLLVRQNAKWELVLFLVTLTSSEFSFRINQGFARGVCYIGQPLPAGPPPVYHAPPNTNYLHKGTYPGLAIRGERALQLAVIFLHDFLPCLARISVSLHLSILCGRWDNTARKAATDLKSHLPNNNKPRRRSLLCWWL